MLTNKYMSMKSLISKALKIYTERGLSTLMELSWVFFKNKLYSSYMSIIEFVHQYTSSELRHISLNNVTVSVKVYPIDEHIPFYTPPYPTEDYPMYEEVEVEALRTYASKGDEVVVIGGGLGVTSVVAHRLTEGSITVYEPNERRCEILERTFKINNCSSDVELYCKPVSKSNSKDVAHKKNEYSPKNLPNSDVFEIDCEGTETDILKNMKARPGIILVETHNNHHDVVSILEDVGYKIIEVVENGTGQHPNCTHIRAKKLK